MRPYELTNSGKALAAYSKFPYSVLMLDFLLSIDQKILLAVNDFHTPALDQIMWVASAKYTWIPLYLFIIFLWLRRYGWSAGLCVCMGAVLAVAVADQSCATLIRPMVERLRPANPDNPISSLVHIVNDYRGGAYGFPSCHAANTFAFAAFACFAFRWRVWAVVGLYGWAVLNCWSRMYLGVHYPSDLIVGALIGTASGVLIFLALRWSMRRFDRLAPSPL